MSEIKKEEAKRFSHILIATACLWFIAHGYRYMNNLHASDALIEVFQDDVYFQRSLGRFMQPLAFMFRGSICAPWLILMVAVVFFSAGIYFLFKIFKVENKLIGAVIIAVLSCNVTWTSASAAFLPWVDIYAVAFFLAILGVWFYMDDSIKGFVFGSACIVISMGFYQAYVDVALAVAGIMAITELLEQGCCIKKFLQKYAKVFAAFFVSGVSYYAVFKLVCLVHHVQPATGYNSLAVIENGQSTSVVNLLFGTYRSLFEYLWKPNKFVSTILMGRYVSDMWESLLKICMVLCFVILAAGMIYLNKKNRTAMAARILQAVGLAVLPFAVNFVYFMSKGMEHELMILSFFLLPVFSLLILEKCLSDKKKNILYVCIVPFLMIVWNNIVFSNQTYFKVDMYDRAALSFVTRMVDDIEDIDGYEEGVTPVVFIGSMDASMGSVEYLSQLEVYGITNTPFNYNAYLWTYIWSFLNVDMNIVDMQADEGVLQLIDKKYPSKDSICLIDGVVYVRLSM